tara:strand:+ start:400 stop:1260 length:861 start_codon:yes stop_codon:yes gene_type:complete
MEKTFSKTATKTAKLYAFAQVVQGGTREEIIDELVELIASPAFASIGWRVNLGKLLGSILNNEPAFTVFKLDGNSKLPFVAFSSLPGVTCPGAGECLNFCYSFRAWRYPAAFARQCQNAFLMRFNSDAIVQAFRAIDNKAKNPYDLRLYVDGDFSSVNDVEFWFDLIDGTKARVYGYSKSFDALLAYKGALPSNYVLNVSSGHNSDADTIKRVKALPITRGDFIAVSIGRRVKSSEHGTRAVNQALRESFGAKAFPCPGACGTCTGKGHACGMQALKGLPIVIAVH